MRPCCTAPWPCYQSLRTFRSALPPPPRVIFSAASSLFHRRRSLAQPRAACRARCLDKDFIRGAASQPAAALMAHLIESPSDPPRPALPSDTWRRQSRRAVQLFVGFILLLRVASRRCAPLSPIVTARGVNLDWSRRPRVRVPATPLARWRHTIYLRGRRLRRHT